MPFKVIRENILKANDSVALSLKEILDKNKVLMLNLISSPGAGKTSLLEKIGPMLKESGISVSIIIGDCFTSKDAERIDALGLSVVQINTGNSCHIDAGFVQKAIEEVNLESNDLIIVENVGNLVCPAEFDLGEDYKIAIHSTVEGADKPIKYPLLVKESALAIINKIDLLEYVDFDMSFCEESINKINPKINIIKTSCKTNEGLDELVDWIKERINMKKES